MLRFLSIVLLSIAAAILYGLIHDQITIRLALEYFTVLHPPILPPETSPTVLALAWGVIATWWVGLILGIMLGIASCCGKRPKLSARELIRPITILLVVMAFAALGFGLLGYELAAQRIVIPSDYVLANVPADHITALIADGFAHDASYGIGFLGGIVLSIWAWRRRGRLADR